MSNVLFATHVEFWKEDNGNRRRISSLLSYISKQDISVSVYFAGFVDKNTIDLISKKYCKLNFFADNFFYSYSFRRSSLKFLRIAASVFRNEIGFGNFCGRLQPRGFSKKYAFYRRKYFQRIIKEINPTHIIIEYISLAYLVDCLFLKADRPNLLIDTHDILYLRNESFKAAGLKHWVDISRDTESFYLKNFDVILAIQGEEKLILEDMLPKKKVIVVPYGYAIKPPRVRVINPLHIGYVGANSKVNRKTVKEFIINVWIELRRKYGNAIVLDLYGSICEGIEGLDLPEGIVFKGKFTDVDAVYGALNIIVNPVQSGGGLKIKNVEALCYGLPLVTTPCGAQGLESGRGEAYLCSDSDEELFKNICQLIEDEDISKRYSKKACEYALQNFGESQCYFELINVLR